MPEENQRQPNNFIGVLRCQLQSEFPIFFVSSTNDSVSLIMRNSVTSLQGYLLVLAYKETSSRFIRLCSIYRGTK
jgi:hypothetical protein